MIKAAKCCNQHLKNIIVLGHFQFCCLWFLKTEDKWSLLAVFMGLASSLVSPLPAWAATPPYSHNSPDTFHSWSWCYQFSSRWHAGFQRAIQRVPESSCDLFHSPVKSQLLYLGIPWLRDVFKPPAQGKLLFLMRYNTWLSPCADEGLISCSKLNHAMPLSAPSIIHT